MRYKYRRFQSSEHIPRKPIVRNDKVMAKNTAFHVVLVVLALAMIAILSGMISLVIYFLSTKFWRHHPQPEAAMVNSTINSNDTDRIIALPEVQESRVGRYHDQPEAAMVNSTINSNDTDRIIALPEIQEGRVGRYHDQPEAATINSTINSNDTDNIIAPPEMQLRSEARQGNLSLTANLAMADRRAPSSYQEDVNDNTIDVARIPPTIKRLPCYHFYNLSDHQWLYWPILQQEATFQPEYNLIFLDNIHACPQEKYINFYITDGINGRDKYVYWHFGYRLRRQIVNDTVSICYSTKNFTASLYDYTNVGYSFTYCLLYYGFDFY